MTEEDAHTKWPWDATPKPERNAAILREREVERKTIRKIAEAHGISFGRVQQIIARQRRIRSEHND